jgi:hypothetical protein
VCHLALTRKCCTQKELHGTRAAADAGRGSRRDEDGTQYYVLDYTARGATWFRHNVSVYAARCAGCAAAPMLSCFMWAVCLHRCSVVGLKCMCSNSVIFTGCRSCVTWAGAQIECRKAGAHGGVADPSPAAQGRAAVHPERAVRAGAVAGAARAAARGRGLLPCARSGEQELGGQLTLWV